MVDGNFSAALVRKDANGNTVTVSGNSQFTVSLRMERQPHYIHITSYSYTLDDGKYNAQLSRPGNANLQITIGADGFSNRVLVTQP